MNVYVVYDEDAKKFVAIDNASGGYPYLTSLDRCDITCLERANNIVNLLKKHFSKQHPNIRIRSLYLGE